MRRGLPRNRGGFNELSNMRGRHRAGLSRHLRSACEQDQRGNAADAETLREILKSVCVHLCHQPTARAFCGDFNQFWRDHLAGAAPRRPEIRENGKRRTAGQREKIRVRPDLDRLGRRVQFRLALTAAKCLREPLVKQSIALMTLRTLQQQPAFVRRNTTHAKTLASMLKVRSSPRRSPGMQDKRIKTEMMVEMAALRHFVRVQRTARVAHA